MPKEDATVSLRMTPDMLLDRKRKREPKVTTLNSFAS